MSVTLEDTFRCPTCRAAQELTDTCRRCKCDLRLVRDTLRVCRRHRARSLAALRSGKSADALLHAGDYVRLAPTHDSLKLLALCALRAGDWPTALVAARRALELDANCVPQGAAGGWPS